MHFAVFAAILAQLPGQMANMQIFCQTYVSYRIITRISTRVFLAPGTSKAFWLIKVCIWSMQLLTYFEGFQPLIYYLIKPFHTGHTGSVFTF